MNSNTFYFDLEQEYLPILYDLSFRSPFTSMEITQLVLYAFVFISGTTGNLLVIKYFLRSPDQPGSRFVISLALIDLIASILVPIRNSIIIIYEFQHWPLGQIGCYMLWPWTECTLFASAWLLVAISLERVR